MTAAPGRLNTCMDQRRKDLKLRWRDVADLAGVSEETVRLIRRGHRDDPIRATETERKVEVALSWTPGSIQAIRDGGDPTPLPHDEGTAAFTISGVAPVPDWVSPDQCEDWEWEIWQKLLLLTPDEKDLLIGIFKGIRRRADAPTPAEPGSPRQRSTG